MRRQTERVKSVSWWRSFKGRGRDVRLLLHCPRILMPFLLLSRELYGSERAWEDGERRNRSASASTTTKSVSAKWSEALHAPLTVRTRRLNVVRDASALVWLHFLLRFFSSPYFFRPRERAFVAFRCTRTRKKWH